MKINLTELDASRPLSHDEQHETVGGYTTAQSPMQRPPFITDSEWQRFVENVSR